MKNAKPSYRQPPREPEDDPGDRLFTYGRPSTPAWIAAAAVAFAFFLLGGFIKTYRQLEALRDESRQEIADLREAIRRLQAQATSTAPIRPATPLAHLEPIPPAAVRYERATRNERGRETRAALRSAPRYPPAEPPPAGLASMAAPSGGQAGRTAAPRQSGSPPAAAAAGDWALRNLPAGVGFVPDLGSGLENLRRQIPPGKNETPSEENFSAALAGGDRQVVSISNAQKRVMVEGGRDLGLGEGARLELTRAGRWIADIQVVDVFANQSSCEVLQASLPPEPGDTIRRPSRDR